MTWLAKLEALEAQLESQDEALDAWTQALRSLPPQGLDIAPARLAELDEACEVPTPTVLATHSAFQHLGALRA